MICVEHLVFERYESKAQIGVQGTASLTLYVLIVWRDYKCILPDKTPGAGNVEVAKPFRVGVNNHGCGVIANHFGGVAVPGRENGKKSTLLALINEALDHLLVPGGV